MKIKSNDIKIVSIKELKNNPKNRNKHPKDQIDRLVKLIEYQGFRNPIVVSNRTGLIVAGHGRLQAASKLKMETVPVIYQDFDSEEQEQSYLISDNAIASWAELDLSGINIDLQDMTPDFDIDLLGIKEFTIDIPEIDEETKKIQDDLNKKYIIEVSFPNDMEMMDIHDDLVSRGYIVKIK